MNKKYILIGLGVLAVGITIFLVKKKNRDKISDKTTTPDKSDGKLDVKSVIPKLNLDKIVAQKAISSDRKIGFVDVEPVILIPDRGW